MKLDFRHVYLNPGLWHARDCIADIYQFNTFAKKVALTKWSSKNLCWIHITLG